MVGVAGSVRENVRLRRGFRLAAGTGGAGGVVGSYLHQSVAPGLGRIAGLVALEAAAEGGAAAGGGLQGEAAAVEAVQALAHKLAMHVVAAAPKYLARGEVPAAALEAEAAVLREQALKSGACLAGGVGWGVQGGE